MPGVALWFRNVAKEFFICELAWVSLELRPGRIKRLAAAVQLYQQRAPHLTQFVADAQAEGLAAVKFLDRAGMEAFEHEVRTRFDKERDAIRARNRPAAPGSTYTRDRLGQVLKTVYAQQRNVPKYLDVAERVGLTQADCEAIAAMLPGWRADSITLSIGSRRFVVWSLVYAPVD